jgi:hypothetical protein
MVVHGRQVHDHLVTNRSRTTAWLLYLAMLVSALPLAALVAHSNPMPDGACSGIGWGCSLYGWDAAAFALLLLGLPYAVGLAVLLGLLSLLPDRAAVVSTVTAGIGLAVPWVVVGLSVVRSTS